MQTPYRPQAVQADARRPGPAGDRRRPEADDRLEEIHHRRLHARRRDEDDQDDAPADH